MVPTVTAPEIASRSSLLSPCPSTRSDRRSATDAPHPVGEHLQPTAPLGRRRAAALPQSTHAPRRGPRALRTTTEQSQRQAPSRKRGTPRQSLPHPPRPPSMETAPTPMGLRSRSETPPSRWATQEVERARRPSGMRSYSIAGPELCCGGTRRLRRRLFPRGKGLHQRGA